MAKKVAVRLECELICIKKLETKFVHDMFRSEINNYLLSCENIFKLMYKKLSQI